MPDGRLIYSLPETETTRATCNFWEMRLDGRTGTPLEKPKRLTSWSDFCMTFAGATADGRKLAFRKWTNRFATYVADLDATGSYMSNPRDFSGEALDSGVDWTANSNALIVVSESPRGVL